MAIGGECRGLFVGLATVDLIYLVDGIPGPNAKVSVPGQEITCGGPACNAAVTFAFLGGESRLISAVGQHPLASVIREDLGAHSIRLHDIAASETAPPPVSSIMVVRGTGERTVVSANAAAFSSLRFEFDSAWLDGVSIILVDGHFMPLCIAVARLGRERGIHVVLDSGSWKPHMESLLPFVDTAICSDNFRPPDCRDDSAVLAFLRNAGIHRAAITRGGAPIRYVENGNAGEVTIEQVHPVDTLAAGDILHGAFCYSACQPRRSFAESLAFAARVATFSCRYLGPRRWMQEFRWTERE